MERPAALRNMGEAWGAYSGPKCRQEFHLKEPSCFLMPFWRLLRALPAQRVVEQGETIDETHPRIINCETSCVGNAPLLMRRKTISDDLRRLLANLDECGEHASFQTQREVLRAENS